MYKLITCDMDDTLCTSTTKMPSEKDCFSIRKACNQGLSFVIATGRGYLSVQDIAKAIGTYQRENQYIISYNGAIITENTNNTILNSEPIDFSLAEEFFKRGKEFDVDIHIYTKDMCYVYNLLDVDRDYLNNRIELTEFDEPDLSFLKEDIYKVIYTNTDRRYLQSLLPYISDLTPACDVSYSSNLFMEFNKKGVSKGKALEKLANRLSIDLKDTIAVGDSFNDLSMIQMAGLGIGVKNTNEEMKKYCDIILNSTNDENPLSEVLERFVF